MTLIDQIIHILNAPDAFGIPFEDYPDWDQGNEPIPEAAQDAVLETAGQLAAIQAARETLWAGVNPLA